LILLLLKLFTKLLLTSMGQEETILKKSPLLGKRAKDKG